MNLYYLAGVVIFICNYCLSRSKTELMPWLSLSSIAGFIALLLSHFNYVSIFVTNLLAFSGVAFMVGIIYTIDYPPLPLAKKNINKVFAFFMDKWVQLPLRFHKTISVSYGTLLIIISSSSNETRKPE